MTTPTLAPDDDLISAARAFFPTAESIEPLAKRTALVLAKEPDRAVEVREVPTGNTPERLAASHGLLHALAGRDDLPLPRVVALPDGSPVLVHA
ncbi:MAG: hypothetical protein ACKOCK_12100, partial [Chloroflexota bacterium]